MHQSQRRILPLRTIATTLVILACASTAYGADSYDLATRRLSMPIVAIGHANYYNMVVTVGGIVSGPSGTTPAGSVDSYNPGTGQLTVQSVTVGPATYHNVVVTVAGLVSIGSVSGADLYTGSDLGMSLVQSGSNIYSNVHATVGKVLSVAGGMPTFGPDTYDAVANQLAIPAVQVGNQVYTNVVITAGHLVSVGGLFSTVQVANFYSFTGGIYGISGSLDGTGPKGGLTQASDGDFYGPAANGGTGGTGAIFRIDPATANESLIYSFRNDATSYPNEGVSPEGCLIQGTDGNFYGTTQRGGALQAGTVFSVTPSGAETSLYSFGTNGGAGPSGDANGPTTCLVQGNDGNFYGTTQGGGANQRGTIFRVTPAGVETIVHSFSGNVGQALGADGDTPIAGLIKGPDGTLYGTTSSGGQHNVGTIYSLSPAGVVTVLYSFSGGSAGGIGGNRASGGSPAANVIIGSDGNFYGTTQYGGAYDEGTAFRVTPAGVETVLHSFSGNDGVTGSLDGAIPRAPLVEGSDGNFYGTTAAGGAYYREGTLFKVTPTGVETVLHSFSGNGAIPGSKDGEEPLAPVIQARDGNLYGTTVIGGDYNAGVVYKVTGAIIAQ